MKYINTFFDLEPTKTIYKITLLYTWPFTQQNEHCDWLVLGHVPLIKFKIQMYPDRDTIPQLLPAQDVLLRFLTEKSKYTTKHFMSGPMGNYS